MRQKDLKYFKTLLLEKKKKLLEEMEYLWKNVMSSTAKESASDPSAYPIHEADRVSDAEEREKSYLFATREGRYLYHLNQALERIEKKTFGKCRVCGEDIDVKRLRVVPHATMCIKCKQEEELKGKKS